MGLPVAAPGLRAWGLALGLRALGHDVTVVVDRRVIARVWTRPTPPALPRGSIILWPGHLDRYVRTHDVDALVVTNSNNVRRLGDLGRCRLVYDFFAPKMLELAQEDHPDEETAAAALALLESRKLAALARSDAVIVNGAKKVPYVRGWLERAGVPELPLGVVVMAMPTEAPRSADDGTLRAAISGYLQPWSRPGPVLSTLAGLLDRGDLTLDLMVSGHWGYTRTVSLHPELQALTSHPRVVRHAPLPFGDFRRHLASCHVSVDVFARNPERELAMVTRSVVALSCGLPVLHVPFTEVSDLITAYDAGWTVDPDDTAELRAALVGAIEDPEVLRSKREGALHLARELLEPSRAVVPLHEILQGFA
ncbi:glycosyltransferase [Nocardioides perillae]|uniref:Glycosyltransferase involved in cell wall biosynthesis n=1 Tax=Nocardioides perillae TaxID=1119534 RepID=A0A7Y9RZL1_9ACTN|nr:hypothetical protein [Nocardioides perillae]NYG56870.1 glycosyltransferase involved in cell wall biosynthesis [Nocardioides perillae]